jgi:hypothetical protein
MNAAKLLTFQLLIKRSVHEQERRSDPDEILSDVLDISRSLSYANFKF